MKKVKFNPEEYVRGGDWDADMIARTATAGVAEEDLRRISRFLGVAKHSAAARDAAKKLQDLCQNKEGE